ncbi:MAG: Ig-like domain-containing protein [Planctomycetota bacterium]|nr:Ig-like domain-containing protein [Planctomycetota bacterium]
MTDLAGNLMNQDGDSTNGEAGQDVAREHFAVLVDATWLTSTTTISETDTTYENLDLVVSGATLTVTGQHTFNSLYVVNTGTVTHAAFSTAGMQLTISGDLAIDVASRITADGQGYAGGYYGSGQGPGAGGGGGGGGHGGVGGGSTGGVAYDSSLTPTDLGSGGGGGTFATGGNGGGAIRLIVTDRLTLDGSITANGLGGMQGPDVGGAGGSVWVTAGTLAGGGAVQTNGGNGYASGGGGGGGRIAVYYRDGSGFTGYSSSTATGGAGAGPGGAGAPGTIHWGILLPPVVSIQLQTASDTGISNRDGLTWLVRPTFDVTVNELGSIAIDFDGDGQTDATQDVSAAGTYTFTPAFDLTDGLHPVTATFTVPVVGSATAMQDITIDTHSPTVTINQAAGQADPTRTAPIHFTVVFSEAVTGFSADDLLLGGTAPGTLAAAVTPVDATTYDVTISGMTGDGTVTASIPADSAMDAAGNLNLTSTSTDAMVTYDVTPPTVTVDQAAGQADPTRNTPIHFTVVFSEAVTGFSADDLLLGGTTPGTLTAVVTPVDAITYDVTISGMTGDGTVTASVLADAAADAAGNLSQASTSTAAVVTYDVTPPTVTINQAASQADPTRTAPIHFTVVFSEAVTGFSADDVLLGGTAPGTLAAAVTPVDAITYDVMVSGMTADGTVTASIPADTVADAAGNLSVASTSTDAVVTYDVTPPTVAINQATGQADPARTAPVHFTVVFSEAVSGFTDTDLLLDGTAPETLSAVVTQVDATTYDVSVSGMTGNGTVTAFLPAGAVADAAGNLNAASTSTDAVVTYDMTPPTVTINQAAGQADPTRTAPLQFRVVFSEAVTGFTADDLLLGGTAPGTLVATITTLDATIYEVSVSGLTGSGTVTASIPAGAAFDAAGNPSLASTSADAAVTYDVTPPTVTINQAVTQADPTRTALLHFTVMFSEPVTGFAAADLLLDGPAPGTLTVTVWPVDATTYDVAVRGMTGNGTVTVSVPAGAALDAAGNLSLASTSLDAVVTYDVVPPTVTINQASGQADPARTAPIHFTVAFSEPVIGFTATDVLLGGTVPGILSAAVTLVDATTYDVTVSGMTGCGTLTARVPAGTSTDAAGNLSRASTSTDAEVSYDETPPAVTIDQAADQFDPTQTAPLHFTVVFSEAVLDFTAADVVLGGTAPGTLIVNVTPVDASTYDVAVSGMAGSGTVTASVPAGAVVDAAGNLSAASTSIDAVVTYDVTPPTVTIDQAAGQADPAGTAPIHFTVVFSEPVSGFEAADMLLGGTAPGTLIVTVWPVDAATYDVAVSGLTGNGTVTAAVVAGAAMDAAGNLSQASTSQYDTVMFWGNPWQNYPVAYDAADDYLVTPLDVLVIINCINAYGAGPLPRAPAVPGADPIYVDIDGNRELTSLDVLLVIDYLDRRSPPTGEGESARNGIAATWGDWQPAWQTDTGDLRVAEPGLVGGECSCPVAPPALLSFAPFTAPDGDGRPSGGSGWVQATPVAAEQVRVHRSATGPALRKASPSGLASEVFSDLDDVLSDIASDVARGWDRGREMA